MAGKVLRKVQRLQGNRLQARCTIILFSSQVHFLKLHGSFALKNIINFIFKLDKNLGTDILCKNWCLCTSFSPFKRKLWKEIFRANLPKYYILLTRPWKIMSIGSKIISNIFINCIFCFKNYCISVYSFRGY